MSLYGRLGVLVKLDESDVLSREFYGVISETATSFKIR